jgi:methionine-rich copper-binding protein CopC
VRPRSGAASTLDLTVDEWCAPGLGPVRSVATTVGAGGTTVDVEESMACRVGSRRSENVAPSLVAGRPAVDAEVGADERPTLRFSEALDPLSLNGPDGVVLVNAAGLAVSATREWSRNGTELALSPAAPLADGRYELRLGSAVTDLAGNGLPALVRAFSVDTTGPRLVSSTPAQGADEVPLTPTITLVFDEPVFVDAAGPLLFRLSDGVDTTFNLRGTVAGRELRLTLPSPLERNRSYSVELDSLVVDALGYPVGPTAIAFRTEPGPLSRPTALDDGALVYAVAQGDINGDGRSDLVYAAQRLGSEDFYIGARLRLAEGGFRGTDAPGDSGRCRDLRPAQPGGRPC